MALLGIDNLPKVSVRTPEIIQAFIL